PSFPPRTRRTTATRRSWPFWTRFARTGGPPRRLLPSRGASMDVDILAVSYDSGQEDARLGRGPGHLLRAGLADLLGEQGHDVAVRWVRAAEGFRAEIGSTFGLCRALADEVGRVRHGNRLPLVLSGNCFMALGTVSGLGLADLGVV